MSGAADQFGQYIRAVADELWGEARKGGTRTEVRYGDGRTINPEKGSWWVHGEDVGGGVLALVERETGRKVEGGEAVAWLREHDFHIEDNRQPDRGSNRNAKPTKNGDEPRFEIVKTWDYVDERGALLFQVCRLENGERDEDGKRVKSYRQRQPDASQRDGWNWSTKGMRMVPYRLPEVLKAITAGNVIYIVEGEKAADRLWDEGVPATTNARGAGKWLDELNQYFKGARVVVIPDNDPQAVNKSTGEPRFHPDGRPIFVGQDHAAAVATALLPTAKDTRLLNLPNLPLKGDVVEWFEDGGSVERLYDLASKAQRFETAPFRSSFNAIPWTHMDDPAPEHEHLIKGILTRGEVAMVAGPSKSGKTFITLDLGMSVARCVEWMGRRVRHGGVIYQAGEGQKGIKKRIRAYRLRHGVPGDKPLPFVLMPARINLYRDDDQTNAFIAEAKHWATTFDVPLELIVIDTWATATSGANENDGKDVGAVLERGARISQATGACVLFVHHMNAEGSKIRGHSSILGNLENVLLVRQVEGHRDDDHRQLRELVVDKNKDGEDGTKVKFVLASVVLGKDEDGDNITSCVVYPPNGEDTIAGDDAGNIPITARENVLLRALENAIGEYGLPPSEMSGLPRDLRVVDWRRVIAAYDRLTFEEVEANESEVARQKRLDARRKELKRLGETLLQKRLIGRDAPLVWLTGRHKDKRRKAASSAPSSSQPSSGGIDPALLAEGVHLWGDD